LKDLKENKDLKDQRGLKDLRDLKVFVVKHLILAQQVKQEIPDLQGLQDLQE
jgi:hypothetical protein